MINAALNGKKVTVFVELKARFDEETNLRYAQKMRKSGIEIIYSLPKIKVHSKICLVIKKNSETDEKQCCAFLGTGNFNEQTAILYGDHGLFTTDKRITKELINLFKLIKKPKLKFNFKHILVPNINMVETYVKLIENEIKIKKDGGKAHLIIKVNGLEDNYMIDKLYEASQAGVKIDLLVRGICTLIPGKSYSKNIRVIRIVDRFLEHARVFYFNNNGNPKIYMGSADWMRRNLYRRIECVFPIYQKNLKNEIIDILKIQLSDNTNAREINKNMDNVRINKGDSKINSQNEIYKYLKLKSED